MQINEIREGLAEIVLDLLGEEPTKENIEAWLASGEEPYKTQDDGYVACEECGAPVEDDQCICYHCAARHAIEEEVRDE